MTNETNKILKHVAIIPDGNRRWAEKRGLKPWVGHQKGAEAFEKILQKAADLKIPYITFWGSSWDNLTRRSKKEVDFLFKIFAKYFGKIAKDKRTHKNQVRVDVLGRWKEIMPKSARDSIKRAIESTKDYRNYFLTFLLAYSGTDEMIDCMQKIADSAEKKSVKVDGKMIKENLWTKDLPPVDLVIRTGCKTDPHLSAGFMMWDTAYSQLYFSETLFPAFSAVEFEKIIKNYSKRERRMGA